MNSADVWLLLDDSQISSSFIDSDAIWTKAVDSTGRWLGNSSTYIGSPGGQLVVTFQGTAISFAGSTPSSANSPTWFIASIDSGDQVNCTFPNAGLTQYYTQWYESPVLDDGLHTVNLSSLVVDVDYAIVTVGQTTPLGDTSTIIVDDPNTEIEYQGGGWTMNNASLVMNGGWANGPPLGNSTHRTNSVGDSFKFQFSGSSISVFGVFEWTGTGSVTLDFNLDNQTTPSVISVPSGSSPSHPETPNHLFFSSNVTAGNHTLLVNVTDAVGNQTFVFDYLTYIPSFESLASKPNFTGTAVGSALPTQVTPTQGNDNTHHSNTGAIVGGVVGGLLGVVLLAVLVILVFRRRTSKPDLVSPGSLETIGTRQIQNGYVTTGHSNVQAQSPSDQSFVSSSPMNDSDETKVPSYTDRTWSSSNARLHPLRYGESTASSLSASSASGRAVSEGDGSPSQVQIDELRRMIDDLTSQNAPPAYHNA
ncbi:hypothetical protein DFJ43DRAFT_1068117 [Lentinula guzmanii]|uniref:Uncharacterized protein n=1 Tax=Lentinula guzmanii TaxID=2804957 RepID=A0AA38N241_9AGAR|nr:hypothetical protein DFJ43DRAFT_1068117 [Lentinula guzmanii]